MAVPHRTEIRWGPSYLVDEGDSVPYAEGRGALWFSGSVRQSEVESPEVREQSVRSFVCLTTGTLTYHISIVLSHRQRGDSYGVMDHQCGLYEGGLGWAGLASGLDCNRFFWMMGWDGCKCICAQGAAESPNSISFFCPFPDHSGP